MNLLLTDNNELLQRFLKLLTAKGLDKNTFDYAFSEANAPMKRMYENQSWIRVIKVKEETERLIENYSLIISLHSKQLFPKKLVHNVRCVNVHPGLNPYNRGWFPQVFSIINGMPCGATIHEMDAQLDHGAVIAQKEVPLTSWDTSYSAYNKILDAEMELLDKHLEAILHHTYTTYTVDEGNINLKKDFNRLCKIDLNQTGTWREHLNLLRALTHDQYQNAYFLDDSGNKVMVSVTLNKV